MNTVDHFALYDAFEDRTWFVSTSSELNRVRVINWDLHEETVEVFDGRKTFNITFEELREDYTEK